MTIIVKNGTYLSHVLFLKNIFSPYPFSMKTARLPRFLMVVMTCLLASSSVLAGPKTVLADPPAASADYFMQACTTQLALSEEQRTGLRAYLEQEIEFMAVQAANHPAAEVAELIPAERAQLQLVAGHLMSPGQLRQFRELEATPQMKAYLKQMLLEN
jgi:hypothetical protein